ncbi:MAG: alginate export family protein [Elusimicrobiota bacterium]
MLALILSLAPAAAYAEGIPIDFSGQFRLRAESTDVASYNPATPGARRGADMLLFRTRLGAKIDAAEGVNIFLQLQDSRTSGSEASVAANSGNVDMHQAYLDLADLGGLPISLRTGRFEMNYGDGRLVNHLPWSNVARAWDGVRLRYQKEGRFIDAFSTVVRETADTKRDHLFSGLYFSCPKIENHVFDFYFFDREFTDGSFTSETGTSGVATGGNLSDRTVGTRIKGKAGIVDYSGEAAWQFGRRAGDTVRAWATALTAGVNIPTAGSPRIGAEYDYASGDADPSDGRYTTFDPIYPFGHALQGHADVFSWRNGHDMVAKLKLEPMEGLKAFIDYHHYRLVHARDAWYGAATTQIARDATGVSGKHVGDEVNISFKTSFRKVLKLWAGYAHFFPGSYAKSATLFPRDKDWGFFQATLNF